MCLLVGITTACHRYELHEITDARGGKMTLRIDTWRGHVDHLDYYQCINKNVDPFYYWFPVGDDQGKEAVALGRWWDNPTTNAITK